MTAFVIGSQGCTAFCELSTSLDDPSICFSLDDPSISTSLDDPSICFSWEAPTPTVLDGKLVVGEGTCHPVGGITCRTSGSLEKKFCGRGWSWFGFVDTVFLSVGLHDNDDIDHWASNGEEFCLHAPKLAKVLGRAGSCGSVLQADSSEVW